MNDIQLLFIKFVRCNINNDYVQEYSGDSKLPL